MRGIAFDRREEMVMVARALGISKIPVQRHGMAEVQDLECKPHGKPRGEMSIAFSQAA